MKEVSALNIKKLVFKNFKTLEEVSFEPGRVNVFIGANGSGKTTILNLAIGFLKADSGQVLVDGNDLLELDLHSYRKQIAVVPQQSILFTGTLRENITLSLIHI